MNGVDTRGGHYHVMVCVSNLRASARSALSTQPTMNMTLLSHVNRPNIYNPYTRTCAYAYRGLFGVWMCGTASMVTARRWKSMLLVAVGVVSILRVQSEATLTTSMLLDMTMGWRRHRSNPSNFLREMDAHTYMRGFP